MKKNVASQVIGAQMVSATNGSAFTGSVTVYVTGDAGTQAVGSVGSGACTHEGNGFHTYAPAQAETNYDHVAFTFIGTGAIPATVQVYTSFPQTGDNFARLGAPAGASVSADVAAVKAVLPSALGANGNIKADVRDYNGTAGTFSGGRPEVNTTHAAGTAWNSGAISASTLAADTITDAKVASDVTIASVTGSVGSVTGNVGGNVTGSIGSLATQAKADVNAEVDTALADVRLDELLAADSDIDGAAPPTVGSVFHELMTKTAGSFTYDQTTDSLEAIRDRGDAAWITATGFSTLDAAGVRSAVGLASANLDTQLSAIDDYVDTEVAAIKAKTDQLQFASGYVLSDLRAISAAPVAVDTGTAGTVSFISGEYVATAGGTVNANITQIDGEAVVSDGAGRIRVDVAEAADAVWEEAIADHSGTSGSTAEALSAAGSAGDPWITALPGSYTSGQAGYIVGTNLNATVSSRATQTSVDTIDGIVDDILVDTGTTLQAELDGIQADTEDIQSRLPAALVSGRIDASVGAMAANVMTAAAAAADLTTELQSGLATASALSAIDTKIDIIDTNVDAILVDTGTDIPAAFDALPTAAEINAEVVDALATDTYAEPGQGAPGATISIASKVGYLYKAWRNKSEQTATEYTLYNDNETTPGQQATVSDDSTTFTRGEMGTGA